MSPSLDIYAVINVYFEIDQTKNKRKLSKMNSTC